MAAHAEARGEEGLLRSAFGLREREYVTLVRVGPVHRCKGVVMVVSPQRPANLDEVAAIINGSVGVGSSAA
jgi:hypothetical protein